ncbi:hypothetical protein AB833_24810 [Chromatiales bacterium (ex Bugula neritina AB1)]|nr:hypothetical protein AB833_24810 [Chromatiales bacterium (ex Bugula neritina AB1)]
MNNKHVLLKSTPLLIAGFALLATGCASKRPNADLQSAQATYERVSQHPTVNQYSTEDLNVAKQRLSHAEKAKRDKKDKHIVSQRAYIAEQYALIAEQRSILLKHQASIENGKLERTRAQMDLRATEADRARSAAEALAAKAEELQQQVEAREARLKLQLAELEELKALQARNTDRGMVLTLGDVLFDTDEATLRAGAYQNISRVAGFLSNYPERTLIIEGHTDNTGDDHYNYDLSMERANAVRIALANQGIDLSRITAKGLGETSPVASNDSSAGRQRNRRVDLIFDHVEQPQFKETIIGEIDE